jgi:hypothetical protein
MTQQVRVQGLQQSERFKTGDKTVRPGTAYFLMPSSALGGLIGKKQHQAD